LNAELREAAHDGQNFTLHTTVGNFCVQHVIMATGFEIDLSQSIFLEHIHGHIATWGDMIEPSGLIDDGEWQRYPYVDEDFSFQPKPGMHVPGLSRIHCFNHAAQFSLGPIADDIPFSGEGSMLLARQIAARLFADDHDYHFDQMLAYDVKEIDHSDWPQQKLGTQNA